MDQNWAPFRMRRCLLWVVCALTFLLLLEHASGEVEGSEMECSSPPNRDLYFQGKHVYQQSCLPCHGKRGKGDGELVTDDWEVLPRDLSKGEFKYRSTPYGKLPTNRDLERTIRQGIAGSAMPTFHDMNQKDVASVTEYIKYFSRNWRQEETHGVAIPMPVKPEEMENSANKTKFLAEGNQLFQQLCAPCHGSQGEGDGPAAKAMEDSHGNRMAPANLLVPLGCGDREEDILRTLMTGMSGTPMPSFSEALSPDEAWKIVLLLSDWRHTTSR